MKRKENALLKGLPATPFDADDDIVVEEERSVAGTTEERRIFLMENGKLEPFHMEGYTASTLYEVVESFSVECRLIRPEDPGNLIFDGKKPSRKTVPVLMGDDGGCELLESWEALEAGPERLAGTNEVLGVIPVRQAFVLKRK